MPPVGGAGITSATVALVLLAALSAGCRTTRYYGQAVAGHLRLHADRRPVEQVIADPAYPAGARAKLATLLEILRFARDELHLPAGDNYRHFVELGRPHVAWLVFAAPEFSLQPVEWCYPVVGRQAYRGYFSQAGARREAGRLRARGFDVYIGGVEAYSTLGWFDDPALSSFLRLGERDLAELIFHELAHRVLYLPGDTDFNEAFATAVERAGVRAWLAAGDPSAAARYEQDLAAEGAWTTRVLRAREQLENLYLGAAAAAGNGPPGPAAAADLRRAKTAILADLQHAASGRQALPGAGGRLRGWAEKPANNARLNAVATYLAKVPGFERLLGRCGGDLPVFFEAVKLLARLPEQARERELAR